MRERSHGRGCCKNRALIGFHNLKVVAASADEVRLEIPVQQQQLNWSKNVHGGYMAYLVDVAGSLAITARTGSPMSGVSTDLSLSYLNAANESSPLDVSAVCDKAGRTLAFTRVTISQQGNIIAQGRHTKFIGTTAKKPKL